MVRALTILMLLLSCSQVCGQVYIQDDFEAYSTTQELADSIWYVPKPAYTTLQTSGCATGNCVRMKWFIDGADDSHNQPFSMPLNGYPEGYIGYRAKLTDKQSAWPKFLKFFGDDSGATVSNWTFGTTYYGAAKLNRISHGGACSPGDTQNIEEWSSGTTHGVMNTPIRDAYSFNDEDWHSFVIYWKLNTNGNADGAFKVWIDDELYMDISDLINRYDGNTRAFTRFSLGEYINSPFLTSTPFYIWFDDVTVASTYEDASPNGTSSNISVSITSPTVESTYQTESSTVNVGGTAEDDGSISSVAWSCPTCTPTSGSATGTTSWSISSIGLASGSNTITVTATDNEANTATDYLTVTSGATSYLAFESATGTAIRADGYAYGNIVRTNNSSGEVTLEWMTLGDTATAGIDYTGSNSNVVTLVDGDTVETIQIPVYDNDAAEDRAFDLILSSPSTGAALGEIDTMSMTILGTTSEPISDKINVLSIGSDIPVNGSGAAYITGD